MSTVRYAAVALKIVRYSYALEEFSAWTVSELLELAAGEWEIEHILCDDLAKQADRLTRLTDAIDSVLEMYNTRRLRAPLQQSVQTQGSYVPGFISATEIDPQDSEAIAMAARLARFRLTPSLETVLAQLHPTHFEQLCGAMLTGVGCENITVTQSSKDDGVDAIAELRMAVALQENGPLHRLAGSLSFLVYAQAKRYAWANPVKQEEVLELEGSWNAMRNAYTNRQTSAAQLATLQKAGYRAADPVILLLMTSGRFTSGAIVKAHSLGIILLDGEQMAQLAVEAGWLGEDIVSPDDIQELVELQINAAPNA